jgi:hypothetical protein
LGDRGKAKAAGDYVGPRDQNSAMGALGRRERRLLERSTDYFLERVAQPWPPYVEQARSGSVTLLPEFGFEAPRWVPLDLLMGYSTRVVEFEELGTEDASPGMQAELIRAQAVSADWSTAVYSAAHVCVVALFRDPFEHEALLAPVGFGHQVHCDWCYGSLPAIHETMASQAFIPEDQKDGLATIDESNYYCWWFGYYLRASESSLPAEASPPR